MVMSKKLPQGWKKVKLGTLVNIKTGKLDANASSQDGEYPFFTCSVQPLRISSYSYDCECVLVAGNGDLNVKYYNGKFDAYQRTYIIESIDKNELYVKYLYYFMSKYIDVLRAKSIGGVIKYIKLGDLTDAKITIPPLEEQERIVSILERAEDAIRKREESNRLLDEYLKSVFVDMFGDPVTNPKGWDKKKLSELGEFKNGMNFNKSDFGYNIKFLGVSEFKYGNVINDINILPSLELLSEPSQDYLLKKGDIVFVRSNGSKELVGRSVLIGDLAEDTTYSGFCIRYRNKNEEVTPDYLISLFNNDGFKSSFKQDSRGCSINNLNQKILGELNVIIPPRELQEKFIKIVNDMEIIKKKQINSCEELNNLFNSLMQRAFNGEL